MPNINEENTYVGTKEASELTGLSQQTIRARCNMGFYETAEHDGKGCPWRILRKEVLEKEKRK